MRRINIAALPKTTLIQVYLVLEFTKNLWLGFQ
jgi:hypothetical protein